MLGTTLGSLNQVEQFAACPLLRLLSPLVRTQSLIKAKHFFKKSCDREITNQHQHVFSSVL
jgi:hypothetical protein